MLTSGTTLVSVVFRGGYYVYAPIYLENLPIPIIGIEEQILIKKLVENIFLLKKEFPDKSTLSLEKEIDRMIYSLYDLSNEEIKIVEGN